MHLVNTTSTEPVVDAPTPKDRETLIVQYFANVHSLAKRLKYRLPPCITFDDLVGAGTLGLIQAVDRFQPDLGIRFGSYPKHRIQGAMLDFLRAKDPPSRPERRKLREATAGDRTLPATISLEQFPARGRSVVGGASSGFAERVDLQRARQCLSAKEQRVISLLYDLDWKSCDVARELAVSQSRVSQIKRAALSKLRACLRQSDPEGPLSAAPLSSANGPARSVTRRCLLANQSRFEDSKAGFYAPAMASDLIIACRRLHLVSLRRSILSRFSSRRVSPEFCHCVCHAFRSVRLRSGSNLARSPRHGVFRCGVFSPGLPPEAGPVRLTTGSFRGWLLRFQSSFRKCRLRQVTVKTCRHLLPPALLFVNGIEMRTCGSRCSGRLVSFPSSRRECESFRFAISCFQPFSVGLGFGSQLCARRAAGFCFVGSP
jgi:RNA polymerase sigma factor (sigma-70 family)